MDPEDVEALLRPYHERVRAELERHGGTVEKFIGDAVMALFGAPTAHEDDPERAVRAALAIRDFAMEDGLELRVGITTGEALISLDATPSEGEGMASGDVVNTAARLQSAAPVNGVLVDETTFRATRQAIDFDEETAIEAKGKTAPVSVWSARAAHSRFGVDVAHEARTDLVGRERELAVVREVFGRARHERTAQLLTLVGVPGIGKSRLVYELSRIVEADPELITWRQGRCLAYGDGVTLWALSEIVKAQAGILEEDTPSEVAEKLAETARTALPSSDDTAWVKSHLRALVGVAGEAELGGDRRAEAFAAWRRFLEGLADQRPLVVVFEDLHWADESLLDFVDELVEWVTDVPLLVVATARPELLERRPGWGGGKLNATTIALTPLTDDQTATLMGQLLGKPLLAAESQQSLLEQAGGNPLYAEQFADLYVERGSADELPLPETLQGMIAARLDGLTRDEKTLIQDAAVVGKVFWTSALGRDAGEAGTTLHGLERKGFIRRQRRSSFAGESELAFAHALVRDVAYGQIPRADRAGKHQRTAEWIEALGRPEDHAELVAYHWRSALDLVRVSGGDDARVAERTRLALRDAGDRAAALNSYSVAAAQYEDALALWPQEAADRAVLVFRWARALHNAYDERREDALAQAREALLAAGETDFAAEAEAFSALACWYRGDGKSTRAHLARAEELAGDSVSPSAARVLAVSARTRAIASETADARRIAEAALAMAETLGLQELRAHALATVGMTKRDMDDASGPEDKKRALEIALEIDSPIASAIANNIAVDAILDGDMPRADDRYREALRLGERFGDKQMIRFVRANLIWTDFMAGRWAEALAVADAMIAECEAGSPHVLEDGMHAIRGEMRDAFGDADGALVDHLRAVALAREKDDPVGFSAILGICAAALADRGSEDEARSLVDELVPLVRAKGVHGGLASLMPFAEQLGVREELRSAVRDAPPPASKRWRDALLLALDGDPRAAAELYDVIGALPQAAHTRLHAGANGPEGETELRKAIDFYRSVGATHFTRRAEALLARTA